MRCKFEIILIAVSLISLPLLMLAQPPHPPGGQHRNPQNLPPAGSTLGEGLVFLRSLEGLYGGKKVFETRKTLNNEDYQVNDNCNYSLNE